MQILARMALTLLMLCALLSAPVRTQEDGSSLEEGGEQVQDSNPEQIILTIIFRLWTLDFRFECKCERNNKVNFKNK